MNGCSIFSQFVDVSLILIDEPKSSAIDLKHVSITSLSKFKDPYGKLSAYHKFCTTQQFDHISWVAPIQNFSLYMGMQLAPCQSYWSMKYHSVIMPTIQKYAGLGFGGESFTFDDTDWFRGRAFPDLQMPCRDQEMIDSLKESFDIPRDSIVVGCFVRSESFWMIFFGILYLKYLSHLEEFIL